MAQSVKINEVTYENVPKIEILLSSGTGKAAFWDTTGATAEAANVLTGKSIFGAAGEVEGTMRVPRASGGDPNECYRLICRYTLHTCHLHFGYEKSTHIVSAKKH